MLLMTFVIFALILPLLILDSAYQRKQNSKYVETNYSEFMRDVENKKVFSVVLHSKNKISGFYSPDHDHSGKRFKLIGAGENITLKFLMKHNIVPDYEIEKKSSISIIFLSFLPTVVFLFLFFMILGNKKDGSSGMMGSIGNDKSTFVDRDRNNITFDDVAGIDEAKEDLIEIVDFLKNPKKYEDLGGKIPKGALLHGEPGVGKTLAARAVAGEASAHFLFVAGSSFVEMFVGTGASRVRSLFEKARKLAPCIIFIDEIDSIGKHRGGAGGMGGNSEREQTLNQLLVELDGFNNREGIIVLAATNRIDTLDKALLRPGRFDRKIHIPKPGLNDRLKILKVHTKNKPFEDGIDLMNISKGTPGFTGADLANLANEASLIAAKKEHSKITQSDLEYAKDKILMGPEKRSMPISQKNREITAYHEAGHVLVGSLLEIPQDIYKVSIVPRGGALGVTQTVARDEMVSLSKTQANAMISFLLGGRCAEELIFKDFSSGASNDIERSTQIARDMVRSWGMSSAVGPMALNSLNGSSLLISDSLSEQLDAEVTDIIVRAEQKALDILTENKDKLVSLANALLEKETLDLKDINEILKS